MNDPIAVRTLETDAEVDAYCRLARGTFARESPLDWAAPRWRRTIEAAPGFRRDQLIGAFDGDRLVGGYCLWDRQLRVGAARLPTGCIGSVVTHPDHRQRGVGRTLMLDAIARAEAARLALLLLDGIPNFYRRFGYADVFDEVAHRLARTTLLALPDDGPRTRPMRMEDAEALLALYERSFARYPGCFVRSLETQRHRLADWIPEDPPLTYSGGSLFGWVAEDAAGGVAGYFLHLRRHRDYALEAMAADWPTAAALLRRHAALAPDGAEHIGWQLPLDSPTAHLLAAHLPTEVRIRRQPDQGWMARAVDLDRLVEAMLPAWGERWLRHGRGEARLGLRVDRHAWTLALDATGARLAVPAQWDQSLRLDAETFLQVLFGFRPLEEPGVAEVLFPPTPGWIPGSDTF